MCEVVRFSDYQKALNRGSGDAMRDGLVPIEFALGLTNREQCLAKISEYGVRSIHVRMVNDNPEAFLYLIGVRDAILINKKILDSDGLSEAEIAQRVDLIQMMENMNLSLMDSMWESLFAREEGVVH